MATPLWALYVSDTGIAPLRYAQAADRDEIQRLADRAEELARLNGRTGFVVSVVRSAKCRSADPVA